MGLHQPKILFCLGKRKRWAVLPFEIKVVLVKLTNKI